MRKRSNLFSAVFAGACTLILVLSGCGLFDHDDGGSGGGGGGGGGDVSYVTCTQLNVAGADLNSAQFWPEGDTYGVNTFYVWELDADANGQYTYHGTGTPVTETLPARNWVIPKTYWSAIRLNLDGLDPYHFNAADPFYLWYLPYTPGASWQSKTSAHNDGTCPGSDHLYNGRHTCQGKNQLDQNAPGLTHGKTYLFRMMMLIPTGYTNGENYVQSCYETMQDY